MMTPIEIKVNRKEHRVVGQFVKLTHYGPEAISMHLPSFEDLVEEEPHRLPGPLVRLLIVSCSGGRVVP